MITLKNNKAVVAKTSDTPEQVQATVSTISLNFVATETETDRINTEHLAV